MLQLLPMMYRHLAHASCSLQGGSFPRIWFGILNALAAQAPEKEFWLAYNDFRNTDSAKYLAQLSPDCSSLPLKPDPEKGNRWKLASVLTSRMGLFSFYPLSHILDLGKKNIRSAWEGHDSTKCNHFHR